MPLQANLLIDFSNEAPVSRDRQEEDKATPNSPLGMVSLYMRMSSIYKVILRISHAVYPSSKSNAINYSCVIV